MLDLPGVCLLSREKKFLWPSPERRNSSGPGSVDGSYVSHGQTNQDESWTFLGSAFSPERGNSSGPLPREENPLALGSASLPEKNFCLALDPLTARKSRRAKPTRMNPGPLALACLLI